MFWKKEYTLNRVHDRITVREGNETIDLVVDNDANTLIYEIVQAQKALDGIKNESPEEERNIAVMKFAGAIFGPEQAQKLLDFYRGNYGCVITICSMYFTDGKNGLGKKITKVQKKTK